MRLKNKNIIITGASRGIGRAIALLLGSQGANIGINYLNHADEAEKVKEEIESLGGKAYLARCDVSKSSDVKSMFDELSKQWGTRLDVLINNAGITRDSLIHTMSDDEWDNVITNNLNSVFYCIREGFKEMMKQKYGKIINISSTAAIIGNIGQANYSASKAGIIGLTKTVALEGARYGIRANVICPGLHQTDMIANVPERVVEKFIKKIPLGYIGSAEDIAQLVSFLAGSESDYITGQTFMVNGGLIM